VREHTITALGGEGYGCEGRRTYVVALRNKRKTSQFGVVDWGGGGTEVREGRFFSSPLLIPFSPRTFTFTAPLFVR